MSASGWRAIRNGQFASKSDGTVATLGDGDIDDVFKSNGYIYEINKTNFSSYHSVYYSELDQYITWLGEGSNNNLTKAYVYEHTVGGFKPYEFKLPFDASVVGVDSNGEETVYLSDSNGFVYSHSINEARTDVDQNNSTVAIEAFAILRWIAGNDWDARRHYRELILRAVAHSDDLTVRAFVDFLVVDPTLYTYEFDEPGTGFILDVSKLDEGVFSDERVVITARADINRVGESIAIGFYLDAEGSNMHLIGAQLESVKMGNRSKAS